MRNKHFEMHYHLMLLPGVILLFIFSIVPMFGVVIAFQNYIPARGMLESEWIGFDNFTFMFLIPEGTRIIFNTLYIAIMKILAGLVVPILFSLLLHEVRLRWFKRSIQTIVYIPHFLSWVILSGILLTLLSVDGIVNQLLGLFGVESIMFFASNSWFPHIIVWSDVWKEFGFSTIVYLAALTAINPALYEAAEIDGASRFKQMIYVTLPGLLPTIILLATLSIGNILNAGFEQIFNLYNPLVYESGDIIDTYVYRVGLVNMQYGLATAVGLFKSVVACILIIFSYRLAYKYANYRIF